MQSRLIVKNFGPIKHVDLDLRNVNVFIGPQASGKSALAKLFTIFKAPRKFLKTTSEHDITKFIADTLFEDALIEYNIASFLKRETEIEFRSDLHDLYFKENVITYRPKLLKRINDLENLKKEYAINLDQIKKEVSNLCVTFFQFKFRSGKILEKIDKIPLAIRFDTLEDYPSFENLTEDTFASMLDIIKNIESHLSTNASLYIPSERNFITIIKNSSLNLLLNNVPIPKHILSFGAELEKANIDEINLDFLQENLVYKKINGEDIIFTDTDSKVKLTEAASGIQSVLPILIPIYSRTTESDQQSFVIEEPELSLFPEAQYSLIKRLERNRNDPGKFEDTGAIHTYTTHSPYVVSALNNLLYADKIFRVLLKGNETSIDAQFDILSKIIDIVPATIASNNFTAYQIKNGEAQSIFNRETGLIEDNYIDAASDKMADDFDALMELMK